MKPWMRSTTASSRAAWATIAMGHTATGREQARSGSNSIGASRSAHGRLTCTGGTTAEASICRRRAGCRTGMEGISSLVNGAAGLGVAGGRYNTTTFEEMTTDKLRLEIDGNQRVLDRHHRMEGIRFRQVAAVRAACGGGT